MNKNTAQRISRLIKEVLSTPLKEDKCNCGCHSCDNVGNKGPVLNESLSAKIIMTENMQYHVTNKLPITENTFRYGSEAFLNLWAEARYLHERKAIHLNDDDEELVTETDLGEYGMFEGAKVPLDLPMLEDDSLVTDEEEIADEPISETNKKKKNPPIGKPKRGGSKKFYVYVRDKGKIKKVSFGDTTGLSAKINNPKARKAFAARHRCSEKTDRTKPSYWSCRIGRYWKQLGGAKNFSGFW
jgi:hypothetical protein